MGLVHTTWKRDKSRQLRHVYHVYGIGSFSTDSRLVLRAAHGWQRLTGGQADPRLIAIVYDDVIPSADELAAVFRSLQSAVEHTSPRLQDHSPASGA